MKKLWTGPCTEVFTGYPKDTNLVHFERRRVKMKKVLPQEPLKFTRDIDDEVTEKLIKQMYEELRQEKMRKRRPMIAENEENRSDMPNKKEYKDKVNLKRQRIVELLEGMEKINLSKVAKQAKSSFATVKRIYKEITVLGRHFEFDHKNKHTEEENKRLDERISTIEASFETVSDLKRDHPSFSRKMILKKLHLTGRKWKQVPRDPKPSDKPKPNSYNICSIIKLISTALAVDEESVLYMDEMKLPLYQTSDRHWAPKDGPDNTIYNIRNSRTMITAIAMCNTKRFIAVQLFKTEVRTVDCIYFFEKAMEILPTNRRYVIILDNASWHSGRPMDKSCAWAFFRFNEAYQFRLNLIENAFSYVRSLFRKRPLLESIEEEGRKALEIFFAPELDDRFKGFYRNHVRNLGLVFEEHRPREDK